VCRIATNYCLNLLRDRGSQAEPVGELPEKPGEHPDRALGDRDSALKALGCVPEKLRAPALLYYVDGLEQSQIAEVLGVSRRTVINRLQEFAARAKSFLTGGTP
jgi:RNA polymerase sigma-70 factor (ECF subfamily)